MVYCSITENQLSGLHFGFLSVFKKSCSKIFNTAWFMNFVHVDRPLRTPPPLRTEMIFSGAPLPLHCPLDLWMTPMEIGEGANIFTPPLPIFNRYVWPTTIKRLIWAFDTYNFWLDIFLYTSLFNEYSLILSIHNNAMNSFVMKCIHHFSNFWKILLETNYLSLTFLYL